MHIFAALLQMLGCDVIADKLINTYSNLPFLNFSVLFTPTINYFDILCAIQRALQGGEVRQLTFQHVLSSYI